MLKIIIIQLSLTFYLEVKDDNNNNTERSTKTLLKYMSNVIVFIMFKQGDKHSTRITRKKQTNKQTNYNYRLGKGKSTNFEVKLRKQTLSYGSD